MCPLQRVSAVATKLNWKWFEVETWWQLNSPSVATLTQTPQHSYRTNFSTPGALSARSSATPYSGHSYSTDRRPLPVTSGSDTPCGTRAGTTILQCLRRHRTSHNIWDTCSWKVCSATTHHPMLSSCASCVRILYWRGGGTLIVICSPLRVRISLDSGGFQVNNPLLLLLARARVRCCCCHCCCWCYFPRRHCCCCCCFRGLWRATCGT